MREELLSFSRTIASYTLFDNSGDKARLPDWLEVITSALERVTFAELLLLVFSR